MYGPTRDQLLALLDRVEARMKDSRGWTNTDAVTGTRREHAVLGVNGKWQDLPEATFSVVKVHRGSKHLGFHLLVAGERRPVFVAAIAFGGNENGSYRFDDGDSWRA